MTTLIKSYEPSTPDMKMRLWWVVVDNEVRTWFTGRTWFAAREDARRESWRWDDAPFELLKGTVL